MSCPSPPPRSVLSRRSVCADAGSRGQRLAGDAFTDRFYGGPGDDLIQPGDVPATKDYVRCGPGTDTVYADKADVVAGDCERVRVR